VASRRSRRAIRLGVPALIIGLLSFAALWRVGSTGRREPDAASNPGPQPPLSQLSEVPAASSVGRRATLDSVPIRTIPSERTMWIGTNGDRVFVVLDPDVKRSHEARMTEGARVTLVGLVRRAPEAAVAMRQWALDEETARTVEAGGTYLHVTEVRPAS